MINFYANIQPSVVAQLNISQLFSTAGGIVLALLGFGFLIMIHEFGHFIMAKRAGVQVNEFSIGMGPALVKKIYKGTQYSIRLFPIGGYVAMEGEFGEEKEEDKSSSENWLYTVIEEEIQDQEDPFSHLTKTGIPFEKVSLGKRLKILLAGATINLIFGFLLMSLLTGADIYKTGAMATTQIAGFYDDAVTNEWLEPGDVVTHINGNKTKTVNSLSYEMMRDNDGIMDITVLRNGETLTLDGVTFSHEEVEPDVYELYYDFVVEPKLDYSFWDVASFSINHTLINTKQIWVSFTDLIFGRLELNRLSGPVGITQHMTQLTAKRNWNRFFYFIALLSLNLGVLNLIPFPALDGGRILFLLIEGVRGKPLGEKAQIAFNLIGMAILLGLVFTVSFNDIMRLFK